MKSAARCVDVLTVECLVLAGDLVEYCVDSAEILLVYDIAVLIVEILSRGVFQPSGDGQWLVLEEDAEFGGGHGIGQGRKCIEVTQEDGT